MSTFNIDAIAKGDETNNRFVEPMFLASDLRLLMQWRFISGMQHRQLSKTNRRSYRVLSAKHIAVPEEARMIGKNPGQRLIP